MFDPLSWQSTIVSYPSKILENLKWGKIYGAEKNDLDAGKNLPPVPVVVQLNFGTTVGREKLLLVLGRRFCNSSKRKNLTKPNTFLKTRTLVEVLEFKNRLFVLIVNRIFFILSPNAKGLA